MPFMGNDLQRRSGTWYHSRAARCQAVRDGAAIVDICMVVFDSILLVLHHMSASHHSDSAPASREAFSSLVFPTTVRFVRRRRQHSGQQPL